MSGFQKLPLIIIGAGIGGLTVACALRKAGYNVEVFEQAESFFPIGAGLVVMANGMRALRRIGLDRAVMQHGGALNCISIYAGKKRLWSASETFQREVSNPSCGILRPALHRILIDGCDGVPIHTGCRLKTFIQDDDGVKVCFENGKEVKGLALIGADGLRSRTREILLGNNTFRNVGMTTVLGCLDAREIADTRHFNYTMGDGQSFLSFPVSETNYLWSALIKTDIHKKDITTAILGGRDGGKTISQDYLLKRFNNWHPSIPRLIENTDEKEYMRWDIFDRPHSTIWGKGRVTLLGDAIHPMAPTFGQGANQAMEDAIVLADSLCASDNLISGFRHYEKLRQPRTRWIAKFARQLVHFSLATNPVVVKLRNVMIPLSNNFIFGAALKWKG
ncbi:hypothetical protein MNBD_GAMMA21-72 [hydrothermal vent metagenome]|uniref:FAD-binding domain-containing protein n=1 Tax=hydrothermal vent metagenome TaxID=652676 RepID=A0A3B1B2B1_9ZZZZ